MALCLFLLNKYLIAVAACLTLCLCGVMLFLRKSEYAKSLLFVFAIALLFCVRYFFFYNYLVRPVTELEGISSQAELIVTEAEVLDEQMYITAKVIKNGEDMPTGFKTTFYHTDEELTLVPGDRISAQLNYYALSAHSKSGANSQGIYISCRAGEVERLGHTNTIYTWISSFRTLVRERLFSFLPYDAAALMNGLLLSDTGYLSPSVYEAFRRCGLLHLTAVSGTHLSVFCYSIFRLLQRWFNKSVSAWLTLPSVLFVMAISGFTPSVMRAGIMSILFLCGVGLFKRADLLNSLGLAAAIMLLYNPYALLSKGFVLSFLAMLGMILIVPYVSSRLPKPQLKYPLLNRFFREAGSAFVCATVASLCTAPASILFFGEISLLSPLLNLLCTFPAMLSMMLGAAALVLPFLFYAVRPLLQFIFWITAIFSKSSLASVNAAPPYVVLWVAVTLLLLGAMLLLKKLKPVLCILLCSLLLLVSTLSYCLLDMGVVHVALLHTRDGMAVMVVKDRECVAIGMGGEDAEYMLSDYCSARSVKWMPMVLLPSCDTAYYNPLYLNHDVVSNVFLPPGNTAEEKTLTGIKKSVYSLDNMEITPFENFRVKVVASGDGYVVQWTAGEVTGLVCMGVDSVPPSMHGADYLITDAVPSDYTGVNTKVFLAADTATALPTVSDLLSRGMESYIVEEGETAEIMIRGGQTVKHIKS